MNGFVLSWHLLPSIESDSYYYYFFFSEVDQQRSEVSD